MAVLLQQKRDEEAGKAKRGKAIKGKWIEGGKAPSGDQKEGIGDALRLVINETEAIVVHYIYQAFLDNLPLYEICAKGTGFYPNRL